VRAAAARALFFAPGGEPSAEVLSLYADLACTPRDFDRAAAADALPAALAMHALRCAAASLAAAPLRGAGEGEGEADAAATLRRRRADALEALLRRVARHGAAAPAALAAAALAGRDAAQPQPPPAAGDT
jgi:hypothetical protein